MRRLAFLLFILALFGSTLAASRFEAIAGPGVGVPGAGGDWRDTSSLLTKIKKNRKNKNDGGEAGERSCPAGYVVLKEKNKYGSFCEPKEGVCPKGFLGTPPKCECPSGLVSTGNACVLPQVRRRRYNDQW
jgi:hypothetical protein